jgi:glycosyltransferase involved in cell wall biosynthesis
MFSDISFMQASKLIPEISVVMPVFNGESFLDDSIRSILGQSFKNFELLIIDDGSSDGTLALLRKFEGIDPRIKIISRENRGLINSLNEGINLSRGKWIARMDVDDISASHRFETQLKWIQYRNADICGSWVRLFGGASKRVIKYPDSNQANLMQLLFGTCFAHPSVLMRADLVKKLSYDTSGDCAAEDYDLWVRGAMAGWRMTNVQEVLLSYRQHPHQLTKVLSGENLISTQKIMKNYWDFIQRKMPIRLEGVGSVIKLSDPECNEVQVELIDNIFKKLLEANHEEAREVIFENFTRLYYRIAANISNPAKRWNEFNKKYGNSFGFWIIFKLFFIKIFSLNSNSSMYRKLRTFYFYIFR